MANKQIPARIFAVAEKLDKCKNLKRIKGNYLIGGFQNYIDEESINHCNL